MLLRSCVKVGSDLRPTTIDGEIYTGDVGAFIGGKERERSRDFLWLAPATHWDLCSKLGDRLLGLLSGEAGRCRQGGSLDRAGAHRIDADIAVLQL